MKQETVKIPEKKVVGITAWTGYDNEINPEKAQIGLCVRRYFQEQISSKILHVINPGTTLCGFTDYEESWTSDAACDYKGSYTYFIGQEVSEIGSLPAGLTVITIPAQTYVKFTTDPGPTPQIIINAWMYIWDLSPAQLGGTRSWKTDFECYDERVYDPDHAVIDVYVGIEP